MAQLTPLPLTVSCFSKIQIGFTFLVPAHPGSPGKRAVKRVCVSPCDALFQYWVSCFLTCITDTVRHTICNTLVFNWDYSNNAADIQNDAHHQCTNAGSELSTKLKTVLAITQRQWKCLALSKLMPTFVELPIRTLRSSNSHCSQPIKRVKHKLYGIKKTKQVKSRHSILCNDI